MMNAKQVCLLCQSNDDLQRSHIVPAFVFRWIKSSSLSGFLRDGTMPNRRIQDGPTRRWLCSSCEDRFSAWEASFAQEVFYPFLNGGAVTHRYSSWMALFCASLCWRTLKLALLECENSFLYPERSKLVEKALDHWREFMFERKSDPGEFEFHFVPINRIQPINGASVHPFINRYLSLGVDAVILENKTNLIVYVKLPKMVVLGMIQPEFLEDWEDTKIQAESGCITDKPFSVPEVFFQFLNRRASLLEDASGKLSSFQNDKISNLLGTDLRKTGDSAYMQALRLDVGLSDLEAALPKLNKTEET